MDIRKIKKIIEIIQRFDISEIEVSKNGESIRIKKMKNVQSQNIEINQSKTIKNISGEHKNDVFQDEKKGDLYVKKEREHVIRSPIIGTFYRSFHVDSKPLIRVGQHVKRGDVLCVIESMKIMNQIRSDQFGTVKEILLKDGDIVEFNTPLMILEIGDTQENV
ncbi:acetyl-CoA carboxylase biotin carboxyl carrier protein [Candidatus Riesia pediculischaeffi]|uniref:Biotin carboxyl carrier protein of acetyl-CoA carboxylase n=2 Tax=Candidatus Riesia pediculischaeffi TaxID=428411 RepID=A0A1V0HL10_9ENTR|nr:acetyl-CoA carboxylase biotin carboxyl carrier protein [Candidatus Riesia pediculischaeffi]ARC53504.1 hypothetical protein AOQ87_02560 [Candidatus Riesia pediculischaeffi]KIE64307.1 Biotin carboxyl carrier protein of acetyl-CoA carboxylase [Candidatus Riesia pediculischaeffi PTSU]